ncbi:MAG: alkaline phosphatase D family protein, partial [Pirellulales bacterium]
VRDRNHLVRKFYLLGDMPEHVALRDTLSQLATLRTITGPVWNNAELIGRGRSASLAAVTAAVLTTKTSTLPKIEHLRERLPTISGVRLFDTAYDPMVCASLPGLLRFGSYEDLVGLLDKAGLVKTLELTAKENETHRLLVDPSSEPQLANGIRIVEVTQDSASVWARATLWPLPNLGDMPAVKFADDEKVPVERRKLAVLPANGTAGLRYAVPGVAAQLRVRHRPAGGTWRDSEWVKVARDTDYSTLFELADLKPGQEYEVQVSTRSIAGEGPVASLSGSFRTLPGSSSNRPLTIAIGTCQEFEDRDGDFGMDMYRTMLHRKSDLFVMAGDVVYYDKLARSVPLADYHWQRTYGVPTAVNFHRRVPTIFLKDDHDTYVNDSWPGQKFAWTADFTFEQGQQIFRRETGLPQPAYRTLTLGPHLQIWFMEGRDYRDANNIPDAKSKTIWGIEQTAWLKKTLADSTAHYKIVVSPTPIVGPDRENKHDNHANDAFATEGKAIRALLAQYENLVVVCGDRHWQYESADPKTGLREFSVGPFSDRHAGGWDKKDFRPELHRFLRVGGGYLEAAWEPAGKFGKLRLTHLDTRGTEHHTVRFED